MTQQEFFNNIEESYARGLRLIKQKNADYATFQDPFKNFSFASILGVSPERALLVRVSDKLARISNLLDKGPEVKDETLDDTILDCCNYLAILMAMIQSKKGVDS